MFDDAGMTVIGSGTSLEGDRWVLGRDFYDGSSYTYLEVETPDGHYSKGRYGSPPLEMGMRPFGGDSLPPELLWL